MPDPSARGYSWIAGPSDGIETAAPPEAPPSQAFVAAKAAPRIQSVSLTGMVLVTFLLSLKVAPSLAYRLHWPLAAFYALFIGGVIVAYFVRRRWARHLPGHGVKAPRPVTIHEARMVVARFAFRLLPPLAAVGVVAWTLFTNANRDWSTISIAFALVWNFVSGTVWDMAVAPLIGRRRRLAGR